MGIARGEAPAIRQTRLFVAAVLLIKVGGQENRDRRRSLLPAPNRDGAVEGVALVVEGRVTRLGLALSRGERVVEGVEGDDSDTIGGALGLERSQLRPLQPPVHHQAVRQLPLVRESPAVRVYLLGRLGAVHVGRALDVNVDIQLVEDTRLAHKVDVPIRLVDV